MKKVILEADGGSRGNPGIAGAGSVLRDANGTPLKELAYVVGTATNNVAEYHGLLNGLIAARELGATDLDIRLDSKLIVEQMSGRWKIKHPDMQVLASQCQDVLAHFNSATFTWVPRAQNSAADALANIAMDAMSKGAGVGFVGDSAEAEPAALVDATPPAPSNPAPSAPAAPEPSNAAPPAAPGSVVKHTAGNPQDWNGSTGTPMRLLMVRHGETDMSVRKQYSGVSDPALTIIGMQQAAAVADAIAAYTQAKVAAVVTSPLERAKYTAEQIAAATRAPLVVHEALAEMNFGQWEGLSATQAAKRDPDLHAQWLADPTVAAPGGESAQDVSERVAQELISLMGEYSGQTIIVVSHVTPIKEILCNALGANPLMGRRMHLDLASLSIAEFYADGSGCVRVLNDTSYLR
ncbi:bifunctional RNase H/acid phosphatase [Corynebacterium sp. HS2168-gen11]|uniref:bifunctional RNase H/acid phosphatase n=1 Tax=Corynebacterium sp. HS2168-gen11 TaxID=2974027 RepID=UPI00216AB31A|nr:bifunctional RNase H/acid phosphatase [Corynebacterium sp. HS2168-gen11]MCS4535440.1 bifunctional RNase H/acid phosphatase [Corynebacterium sp. HS2168-gen11]